MRVAVVGAGIIGVTTAYELAADGHEVMVFERGGGVAAEGSFANAGLASPGQLWCAPAIGLGRHGAAELRWLWRWWRSQRAGRPLQNQRRLHRLAAYSQQRLQELRQQLQLDYERTQGHLLLLRGKRELNAAQALLQMLEELGVAHRQLDAAQCLQVEPGLSHETPLAGGIQFALDEVGNCRQFAQALRQAAQRAGVRFRFHTTVRRIEAGSAPSLVHEYTPPVESLPATLQAERLAAEGPATVPQAPGPQQQRFDAIVVCAAADSAALLAPLGLKLPLQPVWGCSITAPLRRLEAHPDLGPRAALMDARFQVTISRIGQRVRVAGGAELGGHAETFGAKPLALLHKVLHDWFPGAAQSGPLQRWKGARPMLPDGPPLLGGSGAPGVWLNLGHGNSGWALACGSARVLADQVAGRMPAIDTEGLDITRLR